VRTVPVLAGAIAICAVVSFADLVDFLPPDLKHPAIHYFSKSRRDPVALLDEKLAARRVDLKFYPLIAR